MSRYGASMQIGSQQQMPPSGPERKRRRPALACVQCRRRKVRCDREEPCGPCSRLGGGTAASACCYVSDPSDVSNLVNATNTGPAGQQTTGGPCIPGPHPSSAFAVPYGDLSSCWTAPSGTTSTSGTDIVASSNGAIGGGFLPPATASSRMPSLGVGEVVDQNSATVELQGRGYQASADNKRLDPIHATLEAIAAHLQRIEQNSNFSYANTSASSKTGSPAGTASEGSLSAPTTLPGIRNDPEKTKFWGTSHYRHFFDQRFSLFGRLKSKDAGQYARDNAHTNSIVQLVERCRDLRRQIKESRRSTAIDPFPNIFATMPSEDVCQRLVNVYVRSVEPLYRILHIPTFWAQLDRHWRNMDAAPVCFRMKVLLVMAIGSAFTPCEGSSDNVRSNIPHWILAAQWWLAGPSERMTYNMDGLQIRCLLLLACYVNSVGTKASRWIAAGALRRSACSLGLHRDPAHFPNVPPFLAEMRKRLWATVLELDLQAAFDANMPYDVSRDAFDCGPPSDISDDELHEADTSLLSTHKRRQPSQTALQLLLLRYLPLRVSVVRYINAIAEDSSYEEALRLGSELRGFRREIQVFLEAQRQRSKHALNPYDAFQARYLDSMVLRYTLFLNRPFAIKAMHDPRFYYSRKECCDASIALLIPIADGDLYSDGKGRLPPVSIASAAGAVSFDAITYLCLELTKQLEEQGPQLPGSHTYIKDVCQDSRDQILSLLQRLRDRLLESISEGDTSLKKFIFLASALSQIEATAAGRPAERVLTETLRNSLEQCQALLRQHLPADMGLAEPDFSDMFRMNGPLPDFGALDDIEKWLQSPSEEMDNFASTMSGF